MENFEPQHSDILAALRDLQQHQSFTDFTVHLKEGPVHVSRILIAALSPFFRNMLSTDMTETRTNSVAMDHISMETWTCITEFYFGTQKLVTAENVVDVLEASHMYELDRLTQYCCDYLKTMCSVDNCLQIKRIATKLELHPVAERATKVIADNFFAVCKSEDFLCLEKTELLELLEKEKLVTAEDDVCEALLAWMDAKMADADTCTEVFQHVRLRRLSCECLGSRVLNHSALTRTPTMQSKVQQENLRRLRQSQYTRGAAAPKRRLRRCDREVFVVGERGGKMCLYLWSDDKKWLVCPNVDHDISNYISSTIFENTIVVTGNNANKTCYLYDIEAGTWSVGPDLLQPRFNYGMTVIKSKVYVVAGYANFSCLSSIEEFAMESSQWSQTGNLKVETDECGVTALGDTILVAGGDASESASLIQTFNVETRTAAVLDVRLPRPMRHVRAASLGNTAFFVGSEGDLVQITEVEGEFRMTSHVQLQEFGDVKTEFGLYVTDTCVRVIGGNDSRSVVCWNHRGEKMENDEISDLPEGIDICGSFEVDSPIA